MKTGSQFPRASAAARGIDRLITAIGELAGFALFAVGGIMLYETIMRRVFSSPTVWAYTVSLFILMWFTLLAVPLASKTGRHICADFLVSFFPRGVQLWMRVFGTVLALVFVSVLGFYGTRMMLDAHRIGRTSIELLRYPVWILFIAFPVTWFLHLLQLPRNIASDLKTLWSTCGEGKDRRKSIIILGVFVLLFLGSLYLLAVNPMIGILVLVLLLIFAGIPVAFSLGFSGLAAFFLVYGGMRSLRVVPLVAEEVLHNYVLLAIPLFIMGGMILYKSGVGEAIYDFAANWLGWLPGGLAVGTIGAGAIMSAMVGVTSAVAAAVGMVAIPSLRERGYPKTLAYGSVGGGAIGILFPPSAALILYGFLTNTSVGRLFAAALIPALLVVLMFGVFVVIYSMIYLSSKREPVAWNVRMRSLGNVLPGLSAPVLVLGGIYGGWFTPTEAAGVLVILSLAIGFFYRGINWKNFRGIIHESAITSSVILMIILGGKVLGQFISHQRIPRIATEWLLGADISITLVIAGLFVLYIVLGLFLDGVTITLLTVPVIYPMLPELGLNVIVFGVLLMVLIEMAHITPPVGLNLFMVKSVANDTLWTISKGHVPFALILLLAAVLLYLFPQLALWLPMALAG